MAEIKVYKHNSYIPLLVNLRTFRSRASENIRCIDLLNPKSRSAEVVINERITKVDWFNCGELVI